jgi:hypothetical protein
MTSRGNSDTTTGDIHIVLGRNHIPPNMEKTLPVNEAQSIPDAVMIDDVKYYSTKRNNSLKRTALLCSQDDISILYWTTHHYPCGQIPC